MAYILAVDDEEAILTLLENILIKDGHELKKISDPRQLSTMDLNRFDLILLDVMMPEIDGFELCRSIRPQVDCPIVFLTARSDEDAAVFGLGLGADDYIRKPFGAAELRAKVTAHLRREQREHHSSLSFESIRLDLSARQVLVEDRQVALTKSEYDICEFLARHPGQVFSREQILEAVLGWDTMSDSSTISVHVGNIRSKLERAGVEAIHTVWGVGYKWQVGNDTK